MIPTPKTYVRASQLSLALSHADSSERLLTLARARSTRRLGPLAHRRPGRRRRSATHLDALPRPRPGPGASAPSCRTSPSDRLTSRSSRPLAVGRRPLHVGRLLAQLQPQAAPRHPPSCPAQARARGGQGGQGGVGRKRARGARAPTRGRVGGEGHSVHAGQGESVQRRRVRRRPALSAGSSRSTSRGSRCSASRFSLLAEEGAQRSARARRLPHPLLARRSISHACRRRAGVRGREPFSRRSSCAERDLVRRPRPPANGSSSASCSAEL